MFRSLCILFLMHLALAPLSAQPPAPRPPEWVEEDRDPEQDRWRNRPRDHQAFGEELVVRTNETVGNIVLFGGSVDVQGTVDGDIVVIGGPVNVSGEVLGGVVVIGGELTVSGTIERDTVVVLGGAEFKQDAKLEGNSVLIGGPFHIDARAELLGEKVTVPLGDVLPKVKWFKQWLVSGPLMGRLLPFDVTWPWVVAGFSLLFYLLVLVLFPGSIRSTYLALEARPIASIIAGLLAMILVAPLVVVLAMTVVGIAAIPFVKLALLLAVIVGKTAVICFLGRAVGRAAGGGLQAPFLAFLVGGILLTLVYTVPVLGLAAWGLGTVFGLGAAFVALGNSFSREEAQTAPVAVPMQTLRPEAVVADAPAGAGISGTATLAPPMVAAPLSAADTLILRRAGFWRRLLAAVLDLILLALLIPAIGPFAIPLGIAYFVAMWTWKGTTIGSIVLGLKLIRTDGRPVNFSVALVRSLASLFSLFVLGLGFLWAAWDRDKQTWHDKIAGTIVVRMPKDFALI